MQLPSNPRMTLLYSSFLIDVQGSYQSGYTQLQVCRFWNETPGPCVFRLRLLTHPAYTLLLALAMPRLPSSSPRDCSTASPSSAASKSTRRRLAASMGRVTALWTWCHTSSSSAATGREAAQGGGDRRKMRAHAHENVAVCAAPNRLRRAACVADSVIYKHTHNEADDPVALV